jgi:hypothetical protein
MIISVCFTLLLGLSPTASPFPRAGGVTSARSPVAAQGPTGSRNEVEWRTAPDGERGFGAGRSLRDIARLLRSSAEEDRAVVAQLFKLESDLRILQALVADQYKKRGYFELIGPSAETSLDPLGAAFRAKQREALRDLTKGGAQSELLARMLVDARFRARVRATEGFEFEAADLKAGLALLFAHLDGFADLKDHEAELIARRVDLAASRLRAIRLDLEALREKPGSESSDAVWAQDLERLLMILNSNERDRREKELPQILERLDQREEGMCSALFTTRQAEELQALLAQRAAAVGSAEKMLPKVRELVPETPEGSSASAEIQALSKSRRYAYAAHTGVEALGFDPLNEELNYLVGLATDFNYGALESHRWFDRFLALRGIRTHEYKSYGDRKLTREERRALDAVQQPGPKPK